MRSKDCNSSAGQFNMKREHKSCSKSAGGTEDPCPGAAWPEAFCAEGGWRQPGFTWTPPRSQSTRLWRHGGASGATALAPRGSVVL